MKWLTIFYQELFVFSVSLFCSQICTIKLNLRPKIGLTYAISIVKWLFGIFGRGFKKNPSFKIAISGWAGIGLAFGVGCRPRFTFWLTFSFSSFSQSYMLSLFFSVLLSYLVGMKRRASRRVYASEPISFFVMYWFPLMSEVHLLINLFFQSYMLPLFFSRSLSYLVGMKRRTSMHVAYKRDNSPFLRYVLISLDVRGLPFG